MKWTVATKIAVSFGFAVVIFVVVGVVSYRGTDQLVEAGKARQHTYQTLDALDETRLALRGTGIALRTYLLSGEDAHLEALRVSQRALDQPVRFLAQRVGGDAAQAKRVEQVGVMMREYVTATSALAELRRTRGQAAATAAFLSDDTRQVLSALGMQFNDLQKELESVLSRRTSQTDEDGRFARQLILVGTALAFCAAVLAGWWLARDIATPLKALTAGTERVTAGDLSLPAPMGPRSDEIGVLGRALERMTQSLNGMAQTANRISVRDLRVSVTPQSDRDVLGVAFSRMSDDLREQAKGLLEGVNVLSVAASEIVSSSSQLAATASQAAAAVSETTTTVEEVRHTAQLASQKAKLVSDSAQRAMQVTENGRRSTQDVEAAMERIREQMQHIASGMVRLSERTQAVGQVIAAVEDLSTQSNMLAVNAAIEAAKAGEHGRGFGVVAQEVKSLAEQSRQATAQVRNILGDIQKATAAAVLATEEGGKVVEAGARQAEVAGEAVQTLGGSVNEAVQAALQIAASSQQQLIGMDQVVSAMDSIKQASTQNVSSAAELEATARNIGDLGQRLKVMVEGYKV